MHGRTKSGQTGGSLEGRIAGRTTSVAMLCLVAAGVSSLGVAYARGARAEERSIPSYATQRLLQSTGHPAAEEVRVSPVATEAIDIDTVPAEATTPERTEVRAEPAKETRAQRLQRVLKEDGETAARLAPVILGFRSDLPDAVAYDIALAIARGARQHDLRPELVAAVIEAESNYNPNVVSPTDDHGLMQLHKDPVYDIERNIAKGCLELATWRATYQCGEREMLAHYNGGCNPPGVSWSYADKVLGLAKGAGSSN